MKNKKNIAIFLDRDGTLIEFPDNEEYVNNKPENLKFIPGTVEAIRFLKSQGYKIFIVTNQAGVPKGYSTLEDLISFSNLMLNELEKEKAGIDYNYWCIHDPDIEICNCRKPEPGMLLQAVREWNIDLSKSWMIGDSKSDIQAGFKAGCKTILVKTGHGKRELEKFSNQSTKEAVADDIKYDYIAEDLYDSIKYII